MSDDADRAFDIEAEHLSASLGRISAAIPTGVAGECDECGETMPRLVGGRCGYCRDGRVPPLSRFDGPVPHGPTIPADCPDVPVQAAPAPAIGATVTEESNAMPTAKPTANSRTISVPASGAVLAMIEQRSAEENLPWGRAAVSLLEDALARPTTTQQPATALIDLAEVQTDDLMDELLGRMNQAVSPDLHAAVISRAEAAEARLAAVQDLLAGKQVQG